MARSFPGTNGNFFSVGDVAPMDITGVHLTIAAWVRKSADGGNQWVISKENTTAAQTAWRLTCTTVVESIIADGAGFDQVAGANTIPVGQWHHIAVVKEGTGAAAMRAYLDGRLDGVATSNRSIQNNALSAVIGNRSSNDTPMNGHLAHIAIWAASLTADELLALARGASPLSIQPRRLNGYWPLEEYPSSPAAGALDLTQYRSNGTITGSLPYVPGPWLGQRAAPIYSAPAVGPQPIPAPFIAATTQLFPQGIDRPVFIVPALLRWSRN